MRLLFLALALPTLAAFPTNAQHVHTVEGPRCELPVPLPGQASEARTGRSGASSADIRALLARPRTATFDVTYRGFSAEARAAFALAVAIWERHVASDVPIRVRAEWAELGEDLLGSAGPRLLSYEATAPRGLEPDTWYPYALADAILAEDIQDGADEFDVSATFNSAFDRWHFDLDTPAPGNRFDFATVVLHELGHGLGFIGTGDVFGQRGEIGLEGENGTFPYVYDLFTEDEQGRSLLDASVYPNGSRELGDVLTGDALFFAGEAARAAFRGARPPLYAPAAYVPGSSYSHLDEDVFGRGDVDALMTAFLSPGERFETPGAVTCGIFSDMGWPLGEGCGAVAPVQPLPVFAARVFPNPAAVAGQAGCVALRAGATGEAGAVSVAVYDVLGRRISEGTARASAGDQQCPYSLFGDAGAEFNTSVALPAPPAPGLYFVHIRSEDFNASGDDFDTVERWTVVR